MKKVAQFYKVSYDQFKKDWKETFGDSEDIIKNTYDNIQLPQRSTVGSAGYDFISTLEFSLNPGETIKFPTGIRCKMKEEYVLMMFPRSSLGFKYQLMLCNTTGVVDSSYYYADNEGHIWIKFVNNGKDVVRVKEGDKVCQGIFFEYGITEDDDVSELRTGGIGSTGR